MIYVLLIECFTALPDIIFVLMLAIVLVGVLWVLHCHIKRFFRKDT